MTIVHGLESSIRRGTQPARRAGDAMERPTPGRVDLGPARPAWSPAVKHETRAQAWVQVTLGVVVGVLLWFALSAPRIQPTLAMIEAERVLVELRLTLAELRAVIANYRADHGVFPGSASDAVRDPHWFEREWQKAIERSGGETEAANHARLPGPYVPGGLPPNPVNALATVRVVTAREAWPREPDGSTGWIYQPATGELRANCLGKAFASGPLFWDL